MTAKYEAQLAKAQDDIETMRRKLKTASRAERQELSKDIRQLSIKVSWLQMRLRCIKWGTR